MKRIGLFMLALGTWFSQASTAQAQNIAFSYQADQTSISLTQGQSVTVNIYLQEVLTNSATSLIYNGPNNGTSGRNSTGDNGLYGAAVAVNPNGAGTTSSTAAVLLPVANPNYPAQPNPTLPPVVAAANADGNQPFNTSAKLTGDNSSYNTANNSGLIISQTQGTAGSGGAGGGAYSGSSSASSTAKSTNANAPNISVSGTTTTIQYFLGQLIFTGSGTSGTTVFTLSSNGPGSTTTAGNYYGAATTDNNGNSGKKFIDLDYSNGSGGATGAATNFSYFGTTYNGGSNNGTITIVNSAASAPVPEPGSLALCGFAACGFGVSAWKRRKAKLAAELANQDEATSPA